MKRRLISFSEPSDEYLEKESARLGISIPELVRRIVDRYRESTVLHNYEKGSDHETDPIGR